MPTFEGPFTFPNTTITIDNYDPTTGACVLVITPGAGFFSYPALATGDPGLPPTFADPNVTEVEYDSGVLPDWTWTTLSPGGPGVASSVRLNAFVRKGAPGDASSFTILGADDLTVGSPLAGWTLTYVPASGPTPASVKFSPPKVGGTYWPSTLSNTTGSDGQQRTLASVSIAGQPYPYRPRVSGFSVIANVGASRADLLARIANPSTGLPAGGDIVGRGKGVAGSTAASAPVSLNNGPPQGTSGSGTSSGYGVVPASTATTIFLRAEQQVSTSDTFTTVGADTEFCVEVAFTP